MSAAMDISVIIQSISEMESRLSDLRKLIQVASGVDSSGKKRRVKKQRDPNAPKREGNVWIKFTQRVDKLLKDSGKMFDRSTKSKLFAKALKEEKGYEWEDADILAKREVYVEPEPVVKAKEEVAGAAGAAGAEAGGSVPPVVVAEVAAPAPPAKKELTPEQKEAAALKRKEAAAKRKAAKEAGAAVATATAEVVV